MDIRTDVSGNPSFNNRDAERSLAVGVGKVRSSHIATSVKQAILGVATSAAIAGTFCRLL